ncbi:hypothetical protein PAEPH01_1091 [Pancytospora epiphaga]|nr:hypothetical protein PAEPH01_1091 [Pancytospora epiphaga]
MKQLDDLIVAYTNEKATRRLLPFCDVTDQLSSELKAYRENSEEPQIVRELRELEHERLKYFTREYILTRLEKLKSNIFLDKSLMGSREVRYYEKYLALLDKHGLLTDKESQDHDYVGFYCLKSLDYVKIDNEVNEIFEGDFFIANIDDIFEYVKRGYINLV